MRRMWSFIYEPWEHANAIPASRRRPDFFNGDYWRFCYHSGPKLRVRPKSADHRPPRRCSFFDSHFMARWQFLSHCHSGGRRKHIPSVSLCCRSCPNYFPHPTKAATTISPSACQLSGIHSSSGAQILPCMVLRRAPRSYVQILKCGDC